MFGRSSSEWTDVGVPKEVRCEIAGHEGEDRHDNYGKGLPLPMLKRAIDKAQYPVPAISSVKG